MTLITDRGLTFERTIGEVTQAKAVWNFTTYTSVKAGVQSAAQLAGLRYEAKVFDYLEETIDGFLPHLPFSFVADHSSRRIVPDGIIYRMGQTKCCIVEVKLRHNSTAWFQLNFYQKVIAKAFPGVEFKRLEIVKNYDPNYPVAEPHAFVLDIKDWIDNGTEDFGIHIWSGR